MCALKDAQVSKLPVLGHISIQDCISEVSALAQMHPKLSFFNSIKFIDGGCMVKIIDVYR